MLTNKVQQGFFRGAGADPGNFALERLVDAAADELGMDPAELRRKNFIRPEQFPYKTPTGNTYDSGNYGRVLDRALAEGDMARWARNRSGYAKKAVISASGSPVVRSAARTAPLSGGSGTTRRHFR